MYINKAYIIQTKTNLHAGSGDTNFGIVDKEVQRDTASVLPVINGSSLKGAIRNHFSDMLASSNDLPLDSDAVKPFVFESIFGTDNQGLVKFIDAKLLFLPLRSNIKTFYHVTSISHIEAMIEFLQEMGISIELLQNIKTEKSIVIGNKKAIVEDVECDFLEKDISSFTKLFGIKNLAIFTDEDFNEALSSLPVIARNSLENGVSENLWYEEVVPRESIFYTVLCYSDNLDDFKPDRRGRTDRRSFENAYKLFERKLLKDQIQIGANASIGYGITTFKALGESYE